MESCIATFTTNTTTSWRRQHYSILLTVRFESMIVKKYFYVTSRAQLQEWLHKSKTYAWYLLLAEQWHEIWNGTKHGYTYKLYLQPKNLKLTRPKSNGRNGGWKWTRSPVNAVNSHNNAKSQSNVPFYITTVTYKQQKSFNVVNIKCRFYQ